MMRMAPDVSTNGQTPATGAARGVIAAASLLYVSFAMHTPIGVNGTAAPHDDGLFIHHALSVLGTGWFGPFDQLTLAKGQGYTSFLLLGYALGLPVTLMHATLYLVGALCAALAVGRLAGTAWLFPLTYAVLLLHPATQAFRVTRDSIYASQVLLICSASVFMVMACQRDQFRPLLAAGTGLLFGWFWLTREEGVWIVPGLALLFIGFGWLHRRRGGSLRALIKTVAVFVAASIGLCIAYAWANMIEYGKFVGVDFKEANFTRALAALQSVRAGEVVPYVPVPRAVRMQVYAASPAFAELQAYLEDESSGAAGWRSATCDAFPRACGDIAGGWFVWALRDAVASRGYYRNPAAASAYYERLADEIQRACDSGRWACKSSAIPFMPQATAEQLDAIPRKMIRAVTLVALVDKPEWLEAWPSRTTSQINALLGRPLQPKQATGSLFRLAGWYHAKGSQWFAMRCEGGGNPDVTIRRMSSPDVAKAFGDPDAENQRFEMIVKNDPACPLQLQGVGRHVLHLADAQAGRKAFAFEDEALFIDSIEAIDGTSPVDKATDAAQQVRLWIGAVYHRIVPFVVGLGVLAYLGQLALVAARRTPVTLPLIVSTSLWVIIVSRILVVVLVDVSSFPAINQLYLMPAYPLACLVSLLCISGWTPGRKRATSP